jgi:TolB-like protein/tetratricopeptide (TPR) repeat protein
VSSAALATDQPVEFGSRMRSFADAFHVVANLMSIRDHAGRAAGALDMAEGGGEQKASGGTRAVFISYASQDAAATARICTALRQAGIEVWFDQSELRGGDVWDQRIRREIHGCTLFMPVISANTVSRHEGYFRLEWDLADQRTHMMARDRPFIVPVCLDITPDAGTDVPESFHRVQWTRLPGGETPPEFAARIARLLAPQPQPTAGLRQTSGPAPGAARRILAADRSARFRPALLVTVALLVAAALLWLLIERPWSRGQGSATPPGATSVVTAAPLDATPAAPASAAFSPPPHSIAVLPFVNMSGDREQEYFSEGLTEELLNSLSRINELQVAARTSSFSFQGEHPDITTVAHKLNVAAVLEGSVRRSGHTIRIAAQLINAVTGFHLWSKTYDRDLGDVLKLQTEIATAVAEALKVTLLGDLSAKIELGGTRNPAAFDAYLRALDAFSGSGEEKNLKASIDAYTEAIRLDPNYALAFAGRSLALSAYAFTSLGPTYLRIIQRMEPDARRALALAPNLAEGHLALGIFLRHSIDFSRANEEYERAFLLAPGDALILRSYGLFSVFMGRTDTGIAAGRHAVALDPLNRVTRLTLGQALYHAHQYEQAISVLQAHLVLHPDDALGHGYEGLSYYSLGKLENARTSCEAKRNNTEAEYVILPCLAITYDKLGRHADAEAILMKESASEGDADAYQYAQIYAQRADSVKALNWLETAQRLRDAGFVWLKTDPLLDPLRKEPRFQAIEHALKFPLQ